MNNFSFLLNFWLYQASMTYQHMANILLVRLDVGVNNAGYGVDGVFKAMSDEVIEQQFNTNVFCLMRVTRVTIRHMRAVGGGIIIQVSSMVKTTYKV